MRTQGGRDHIHDARSTGQRVADDVARTMGSWRFIIIQSVILAGWITLNVTALVHHWDPMPFILLNLGLSFQAAYAAPIIMMSQNRQAEKDRLRDDHEAEKVDVIAPTVARIEGRIEQIVAHLEAKE